MEDFQEVIRRHLAMTNAECANSLSMQWSQYAPLFRAASAMAMDTGLSVPPAAAEEGRAGRATLRAQLERAMDDAGIDVWVTPGSQQGPAPLGLRSTGNRDAQIPWTHAGLPTFSMPTGLSKSPPPRPMALQFASRRGHDEALLGWCVGLESVISFRVDR